VYQTTPVPGWGRILPHDKGRRKATRKLLGVHSPYKQDPHLAYVQTNEKGPDDISGEFAEYPT